LTPLAILALLVVSSAGLAAERPGLSLDANPQGGDGPGQTVMQRTEDDCSLITFEGIGDNVPIGVVAGPVNVTFGTSWLALVDFDDGGNGNFANEPSSFTTAYFLDQDDISITLDQPVQFLEFFYTAAAQSLPVTVTAFDSGGGIIDTAIGNTIGTDYDGADCVGDPTGNFCTWDVISFTSTTNDISSIQITGSVSNFFGIDNLQFCVQAQDLVPCCLPDANCAELTAEGCLAAGGVIVDAPNCENVECESVSTENHDWSSIKSLYR
jgi:hypothetical protein